MKEELKQAAELLTARKYKQALDLALEIEKEIKLVKRPDKNIVKGLYYILAKAYNGTKQYEKADQYFVECLKFEPKNLDLLYSAGINSLALRKFDEAHGYLRLVAKYHGRRNPLYLQLEKTISQWETMARE